jgi:hypothetical protein
MSDLSVRIGFLNRDGSTGSRVYLFGEDMRLYQVWKMVHKEIAFYIHTSTFGCGTNRALFLSKMDAAGGSGR